jgi:hypothetical protein
VKYFPFINKFISPSMEIIVIGAEKRGESVQHDYIATGMVM